MKNSNPNIVKHSITFLFEWRPYSPYRFAMYFLMYASMPMFFYGIQSYNLEIIKIIIFTIIVMYTGFFAAIIWNDICDVNIDRIAHPKRAVPTGKISKKKFFGIALVFSGIVFIFSYMISLKCFLFVGVAALFVAFHNKYLRRIIRIPAYSEIVTPLQWTIVPIFGFLAVNSSNVLDMLFLVIFTYLTDGAHDLPEGIHDAEGDRRDGIRTYTTSFNERASAKVSFTMLFVAGVVGFILYYSTSLTPIFLIPFLLLWAYTLYISYRYLKMKKEEMEKFGLSTGLKIYRFFWATYVFIFIDIFTQIVNLHFFS